MAVAGKWFSDGDKWGGDGDRKQNFKKAFPLRFSAPPKRQAIPPLLLRPVHRQSAGDDKPTNGDGVSTKRTVYGIFPTHPVGE